jgi:hypothetical protein
MCKLNKNEIFSLEFFNFYRNYDEDFEDEDNGNEEGTNKKLTGSAVSPPQRISSALSNKSDDIEDALKRWKD